MASGPVTRAANSGQAADVLFLIAKGRKVARGGAESLRAGVVHALALPSHRDVQLVEAKVERLQRTMDEWSAEAQDREPRR